jgi:hypothetical protein
VLNGGARGAGADAGAARGEPGHVSGVPIQRAVTGPGSAVDATGTPTKSSTWPANLRGSALSRPQPAAVGGNVGTPVVAHTTTRRIATAITERQRSRDIMTEA